MNTLRIPVLSPAKQTYYLRKFKLQHVNIPFFMSAAEAKGSAELILILFFQSPLDEEPRGYGTTLFFRWTVGQEHT